MKQKHEFLAATAMLLVIAGLAVVFIVNVLEGMKEVGIDDPPPLEAASVEAEPASALPPFPVEKDIFDNPWVPDPTPTPEILPTPTPTPTPFAVWDVILIIGDSVQIRDAAGGLHYLREGDTFEGCAVVKVDWETNSVQVRPLPGGPLKTVEKMKK